MEYPNYGTAKDWCQSAFWQPHSCHCEWAQTQGSMLFNTHMAHMKLDRKREVQSLEADRNIFFLTLGLLLPCCAERAGVHSGSDRCPVLRTGTRCRRLQYTHLERGKDSHCVSICLSIPPITMTSALWWFLLRPILLLTTKHKQCCIVGVWSHHGRLPVAEN